jgi:hypothetical protein
VNAKNRWVLLVTLVMTAAGCHKKTTTTPAASQQTQPGVAETPQPLVGEVHPFMTSQLQIFVQQAGRLPTNFTELARARLDLVPRTTPGMKWAIDPATAEVKLVKQ